MVAPVIDNGTGRSVKLPEGNWTDETGQAYEGGNIYQLDVPLSRLPIFYLNK